MAWNTFVWLGIVSNGESLCIQFHRMQEQYQEAAVFSDFWTLSFVKLVNTNNHNVGRNSSVGIATRCSLIGSEFETKWGQYIFSSSHSSRRALMPTQPHLQLVSGLFSGVKRPGRGIDHPPHLAPTLRKNYFMLLLALVPSCLLVEDLYLL
jgi:hypothetical protein